MKHKSILTKKNIYNEATKRINKEKSIYNEAQKRPNSKQEYLHFKPLLKEFLKKLEATSTTIRKSTEISETTIGESVFFLFLPFG